jgi:hypothetical protein
VGSTGHIVHSGAFGARNFDTLFFMLGWDQYGLGKRCIGTRYVELLFFYPVGSPSHAVHFGASEERIVDTLFFKLRWERYRFDKKQIRTLYAKLVFSHPVGSTGNVVHSSASGARNVDALFSCSGGTGTDSIKIVLGHVTSNFCFCILWDMRVT